METSSPWPPDVEAEVTYLATEDGGRKKPTGSRYRSLFYYDGHHWDTEFTYPDVERVMPGETARAYLTFLSPECHAGRLFPGTEFEIHDGRAVLARGRIMRIVDLEANAKRVGRDASDCR